jgi:hypothetical protein
MLSGKHTHMTQHMAADNCILLAQGVLAHDGVFHAHMVAHPPVEPRADMAEACKVWCTVGRVGLVGEVR